ncbi:hypothetical protein AWB79_02193 [Caballeronia hypogeia]|uniref:Uncharacterized protein n=1 Tax=Caballeronia hypogeia TaxID=1777140 RepID=A0A158ACC1_9BURK|nr:hypothetical protein AWB79_02193 [Caballeronia hypogeia]
MLLVTLELLPRGSEEQRRTLGQIRIINVGGDPAYGNYSIELMENREKSTRTASITDYPRHAGSTWDLVARAITMALAGKEELPPRPVHPWGHSEDWQ